MIALIDRIKRLEEALVVQNKVNEATLRTIDAFLKIFESLKREGKL